MTDRNLLHYFVKRNGFINNDMAELLGLTLAGYYLKLANQVEFKPSEIKKISDKLNLTMEERDKIFFAG